jgi:signal peptidase I
MAIEAVGSRTTAGSETSTNVGVAPSVRKRWFLEATFVLLTAIALSVLLRTFVVQTFFIPSRSMVPTLNVGDRIVVDKLSFELHGVARGDIVVFSRPAKEHCAGPPVADLVKRVIGLPGETISLNGHGRVEINRKVLNESWLPRSVQGTTWPGPLGTPYSLVHPYMIPAGDYFVMGDDRGDSCDSRYWGPISSSLIVGKVDLRIWPLTALRLF